MHLLEPTAVPTMPQAKQGAVNEDLRRRAVRALSRRRAHQRALDCWFDRTIAELRQDISPPVARLAMSVGGVSCLERAG